MANSNENTGSLSKLSFNGDIYQAIETYQEYLIAKSVFKWLQDGDNEDYYHSTSPTEFALKFVSRNRLIDPKELYLKLEKLKDF